MALGATVRTLAASTAAAPRPAQRKPRDQARRDANRVLRLMLTRRFYGFSGPRSYPRFLGTGCGSPSARGVTSTYREAEPTQGLGGLDGVPTDHEAAHQRVPIYAAPYRVRAAGQGPPVGER